MTHGSVMHIGWIPSDGLDPSRLQKGERMAKTVMDFSEKDLDLLGLTWDEALDLTKDRSEW